MRNASLPPIAKVVWSLIAGMRDDYKPTIAKYCSMARCHPDTWRATVKMLESYGMIIVKRLANGVNYTAIADPGKWNISPSKGTKISQPMKNSQGMKISEGEGMKISQPIEEHIKQQKNNNDDAHARVIIELKSYDQWTESMCKNYRLTYEQFCAKVDEFEMDMACHDIKIEGLKNARGYFNKWLDNKRINNGQRNDDKNKRAVEAGARAIASLAAKSGQLVKPPF